MEIAKKKKIGWNPKVTFERAKHLDFIWLNVKKNQT